MAILRLLNEKIDEKWSEIIKIPPTRINKTVFDVIKK